MVRSINDSVLGDAVLMKQSVATKAIHNATKMPNGLSEDVVSYMKKVHDPKKRYRKYLHAIHPYKLTQPEQKYYKTAAELNREKELYDAAMADKQSMDELADLMKATSLGGETSKVTVETRFGDYEVEGGDRNVEMGDTPVPPADVNVDMENARENVTRGTFTAEEYDEAFGDTDAAMRDGTTTGSYNVEEVDEAFGGVSTIGPHSTTSEIQAAIEATNRVTDPTVYRVMPDTPVTPPPPPPSAQVISPYDEAELEAQSLDLLDERATNLLDEIEEIESGTSKRYDMSKASDNLSQQTEERANRRQDRGDTRREDIVAAMRGFDARVNALPDDVRRLIVEQATANTRPQNWTDTYNDQVFMDAEDL